MKKWSVASDQQATGLLLTTVNSAFFGGSKPTA
jgi:HD-like signal output (HDOD) protein